MPTHFAQRDITKKFIRDLKISPDTLAERSGVGRATIYKFLNGADIRLSTWNRLKVAIDELTLDVLSPTDLAIPPPPASEQAQAHDDTEQGDSAWTSAV